MISETNDAELEAIKQEFAYCTENLLRLTSAFTASDITHPEVIYNLRKAQVTYNDAYLRLAYFIDREYRKAKTPLHHR